MSRNWTNNQRMAIDARRGSLLVSAAAGSGKTAVLVERVIRMVTDSENPIPIERLLIVTYTRAAAAELNERITRTLNALISENPDNKWYRRQLVYLPCANISTVDSFCSNVVKEFFQYLNVSSDYRIADDSELSILKDEAMERTLNKFYIEGSADFYHLVESFSGAKNDTDLRKYIYDLYVFLRSHPFEDKWMDEKIKYYTDFTSASESVWGRVVTDYLLSATEHCINITNSSIEIASREEELFEKISPLLGDDLNYLETLKQKLVDSSSWDELSSFADSFVSGTLSARGYTNHPIKLKVSDNRSEVKDIVSKIRYILRKSECDIQQEVLSQTGLVSKMFEIVRVFKECFSEIKLSKNIADFSDVSHWTLDLLVTCDSDGVCHSTDIAKILSQRFDAVMVDEFQDANEVQDLIFRSVSHDGSNLFVVGDVKQSIYGFRQAMPEIFLGRKNSLPLYDPALDNYPSKVILEKNFRSRQEVTDFVNFVFTSIMSEQVGDMEYTEEEHLVPGADYTPTNSPCAEIHLLDMDEIGDMEGMVAEARHIAALIYEKCKTEKIKDGNTERPLRFGDIAILMRYTTGSADVYARELRRLGIPAVTEKDSGFLKLQEITMVLNLLRVIDNPLQDIPLMSVLMSPVFAFTVDEMASMRTDSRKLPLYMSLVKFADEGNVKAQRFIEIIKELRNLALSLPSDRFIGVLYDKTGLLAVSKAIGGEIAYNNLLLLKEYAAAYEKGASKGISAFVGFADKLIASKKDMAAAVVSDSDNENVVRIMTVHSSKGLEFPLCILANTHRVIKSDKSDNILVHSKLGFASKYRDEELMCDYNTFTRDAVVLETIRNERSEEIRILYVALTRAKEKLVIVSSRTKLLNTISKWASVMGDSKKISPFILRDNQYLSDWIIMIALMHPDSDELRLLVDAEPKTVFPDVESGRLLIKIVQALDYDFGSAKQDVVKKIAFEDTDDNIEELIKERFDILEYPDAKLCALPQKVTASALSHKDSANFHQKTLSKPRFALDSPLTAAEQGTAMHTFMQYCDLLAAKTDLDREIARLVATNRLTEAQSKSLKKDKLTAFLNSSIISRAMLSDNCYREYRFTVNIPACLADDTLTDEARDYPLILQGAVDLAFEEKGGIIIVDYKTDRVTSLDELKERYQIQLELYKYALEQTTGKEVVSCLIYSVHLKESLEVL